IGCRFSNSHWAAEELDMGGRGQYPARFIIQVVTSSLKRGFQSIRGDLRIHLPASCTGLKSVSFCPFGERRLKPSAEAIIPTIALCGDGKYSYVLAAGAEKVCRRWKRSFEHPGSGRGKRRALRHQGMRYQTKPVQDKGKRT